MHTKQYQSMFGVRKVITFRTFSACLFFPKRFVSLLSVLLLMIKLICSGREKTDSAFENCSFSGEWPELTSDNFACKICDLQYFNVFDASGLPE